MQTAKTVREELPDVQVKLPNGNTVIGHVRGRMLDFPVVWWNGGECEAAWDTIAFCLNNGRPLQA